MKLAKKLIVIADRYGLAVLAGATGVAFAGAFGEAVNAVPGPWSWSDAINAVRDALNADSDSRGTWMKSAYVARDLTLAWAAVRIYMATAGLKWDTYVARLFARDHVIIAAGRSSRKASPGDASRARRRAEPEADKAALAIELALSLASDRSVVLHLPDIDPDTRGRLWDAGVKVLTDDVALPRILVATGARRARLLVAMRDLHTDNLTLALAALSPETGNPGILCKIMIEPIETKRDFRPSELFDPSGLPRIRVFNESELIGRRLVRAYPPDVPVAQSAQRVHLLLVGLGSVGQSILLQLARIGHYRSGLRPRVTVIDRDVRQHWQSMVQAYPAIGDWIDVGLEELRIEEIGNEDVLRWLGHEHPVTMVYVCTKDEIANLRIARRLLDGMQTRARQGGAAPARVVALDPAGGCVLSDFAQATAASGLFSVFSLLHGGEAGLAVGLISDVDDLHARRFHEGYCAKDDALCAADPSRSKAPNNLPWDQLDEDMRDANRFVSDHFEVKVRAIGCVVASADEKPEATLTADELEQLARMEHDRWWADKALAGFRYGPQRDRERKLHPYMLPYDDLTEEIRQLDRDSVLEVIAIMRSEGIVIARR